MAPAAAPAATDHLGLNAARVHADAVRMRPIAAAESRTYRIPGNASTGIPQGIDVHRVARSGITPLVATGLLHRAPGGAPVTAVADPGDLIVLAASTWHRAGVNRTAGPRTAVLLSFTEAWVRPMADAPEPGPWSRTPAARIRLGMERP